MRIFVAFEDVRLPLDVQPGQSVGDVKTVLRDYFKLNSSHMEDKILQLTYAGAILNDAWICSDIGISSGATVKSLLKDSDKPVLHINCAFNDDIIAIREQIDHSKTSVKSLREMVSKKTGLPVSVFRLCTPNGEEMFDGHTLHEYKVTLGTTITLHVWDGWCDLLAAAIRGHTKRVYRYASTDEQIARFQYRVACYIAAHFGHVDLANSLINPRFGGVKPEEPVGQHPTKLWSIAAHHPDIWKCPVHEAAQCGKVNVLRIFVQNNICCLVAKDSNGHTPIQVCCKYDQTDSILYLSSKLYSSYTENNVTLPMFVVIRCRKWCEKARDKVLSRLGAYCSSMKRRSYKGISLVGHGVLVDGYGENWMHSKAKASEAVYLSQMESGVALHDISSIATRQHGRHQYSKQNSNKFSPVKSLHDRKHLISIGSSTLLPQAKDSRFPSLSRSRKYSSRDSDEPRDEGAYSPASYIHTPKLQSSKQTQQPQNLRNKKTVEAAISLPAVSVENTLRPFFHVSSRIENPVLHTMKVFENYRDLCPRDNAIHCMSVASTFKDKAWLRQVDLAISLAKRGVLNCLVANESAVRPVTVLPTVLTNSVKIRS
ncbi:protein ANKUB1-like [Clavelina lepadiformis]|uniref:Ubiquitin-like domain-containing protein n=1 Tax=Clavelina lepadiformis TaxID=159417 RepID=A0ABP0GB66_CLALP